MSAASALIWGVKASLLEYVRGMPDGRIELGGGVTETASGAFSFPAAPTGAPTAASLRFSGSVTLVGHGGMMRVVVADPRLDPDASAADASGLAPGGGWSLSIDDGTGERLRFAELAGLDDGAEGRRVGRGTVLTADGADLFFGPYRAGTPLDDPVVIAAPPRRAG